METKTKKKKTVKYVYWFAFADRCNKLQNAIADCNYKIDSRERMLQAQDDIRRFTGDNFRAFYNFQLLRKKYVECKEEEK